MSGLDNEQSSLSISFFLLHSAHPSHTTLQMSFDQQMGQVRPIHDAAARLRLVKNSLSDLEVEGVTIAGSTAVYLHAFAQESGVPPHEVAYLLCDVTFPKEYIVSFLSSQLSIEYLCFATKQGILMLTPGSLQHKVTKIEKLKLELKRSVLFIRSGLDSLPVRCLVADQDIRVSAEPIEPSSLL